jgi:hypothetical protein
MAVTSIGSRFLAPPTAAQLEGTTLTLGGIAARERPWVKTYGMLVLYFLAILAFAGFSHVILAKLV